MKTRPEAAVVASVVETRPGATQAPSKRIRGSNSATQSLKLHLLRDVNIPKLQRWALPRELLYPKSYQIKKKLLDYWTYIAFIL